MASTICPSARVISNRLFDVDPCKYFQDKLYPNIIKNLAGQKVTAMRIIIVLYCAFHEFYSIMNHSTKTRMIKLMETKIVEIIKALVNDDIVIKDTLELWALFTYRFREF